jgi:hypothetical protein
MFLWLWDNVFPCLGLIWLPVIAAFAFIVGLILAENKHDRIARQVQLELELREDSATVEAVCQAINSAFAARRDDGSGDRCTM